jgi:hypothetical protein
MTLLPDSACFLPDQSEAARAADYPYSAPEGPFILDRGQLYQFDDAAVLTGRTAVLSVGSNRAPVQLRRKFGDAAVVPVTPAILHDCDIVHNAAISYYGAVSCTAFPSKGTDVLLNVAWLDEEQLAIMHTTEAVGIAYDFIRFFNGVVGHLPVPAAGGDIVAAAQPVYGYASCSGVLDAGGGQPAGLAAIDARHRRFQTLSQGSAAALIKARTGAAADMPTEGFIAGLVADPSARQELNRMLADAALHADGPWQTQTFTSDAANQYL